MLNVSMRRAAGQSAATQTQESSKNWPFESLKWCHWLPSLPRHGVAMLFGFGDMWVGIRMDLLWESYSKVYSRGMPKNIGFIRVPNQQRLYHLESKWHSPGVCGFGYVQTAIYSNPRVADSSCETIRVFAVQAYRPCCQVQSSQEANCCQKDS